MDGIGWHTLCWMKKKMMQFMLSQMTCRQFESFKWQRENDPTLCHVAICVAAPSSNYLEGKGGAGKNSRYSIKGGMKDGPLFSFRFIPEAHFSGNSPHFPFYGRITPEKLSSGKGRRIYFSSLLPVYFRDKRCRSVFFDLCCLTLWWVIKGIKYKYKRNI